MTGSPAPSRLYSRYVLGLLFLVYMVNFVDRNLLAILLEDIKAEMQVSDTAMGFLSGPAFAIFYTLAGIPIARWADVGSRRLVISLGLAVWSAMTAISGLTTSFVQLALARIGVGVGEAAGSPPAHSLLSDYFPPERRATALAIYATGGYVGVAFGFLAGSLLRESFDWRTVFILAGLPGIPLAILVRLTLREPPRGGAERGPVSTRRDPLPEVLRYLLARRSFLWLALAASCQALSGYSLTAWTATFLVRVHGMGWSEIGLWLGLIMGIGGALGATLGGRLADRLGARDPRWVLRVPAIGALTGIPFALPFVFLTEPVPALLCFIPYFVLVNTYVGPMYAMTQALVRVRMRAVASAVLLFLLNMIGLGVGPLLVGVLNDLLAPRFGDEAIRWSLACVAMLGTLAAPLFLLANRTLREDLEAARGPT